MVLARVCEGNFTSKPQDISALANGIMPWRKLKGSTATAMAFLIVVLV